MSAADVAVVRRSSVPTRVTVGTLVLVLALGIALVAVPVVMMMGTAGMLSGEEQSASGCSPTATAAGQAVSLSDEQLQNAAIIVRTGALLQVPDRGLVIAVATAMQESTLRNLGYGDRDSVGLFQQRAGWGSLPERTDPATSATMFFTGGRAGQPGLLDIRGWSSMAVSAAAQAVQRSAFPNAYAKWQPLATSLVRSVTGSAPLTCTDAVRASLPGGAVGDMLQVATAQQGDPYVWGATGPDAFDCSGLLVFAWRQAGFQLSVRTAAQMHELSTPVPAGQEQPGDLLFGAFDSHAGPGRAGHVMIVVEPGTAVQAPAAGRVVELSHYTADGVRWRLGRLPASALRALPRGA